MGDFARRSEPKKSQFSDRLLVRSRGGPKVGFVRLRRAILLLAIVSFGIVLWTSKLGGELRHNELRSRSQTASFSTHR
jgi:hypothetical protein